ncbi:MAG: polyribonucleotide nucleotidyltransferase [Chloroflexi bacterium]|nr:polyribonucleotide nucleotidyltransferase [Chloroflexota bacterium]
MSHIFQCDIAGKVLTIENGKLAGQANGSVTVRYGDSVVLVTACLAQPREGIDFFPLTVDYEERLYAAGKIPGSFFRREGRPSQEAVLSGRLVDRSLRPLFPKGFKNEVQVIVTVLSTDKENPPDVLAIIGASTALSISEIPFGGPVAATRVGYIDGELVVNPTFAQLKNSLLDMVVSGTKDEVVMVEAGANEVTEEMVLEGVKRAQETNRELVELQREMIAKIGKPNMSFSLNEESKELDAEASAFIKGRLVEAIYAPEGKPQREESLKGLKEELLVSLKDKYSQSQIAAAFESLVKKEVRNRILKASTRPDGRGLKDIRQIDSEVGVLPRIHGSGLFIRGLTQVLTIATLGSVSEVQRLDTLSPEDTRRFLHHYNFPPYSVGEVRRVGSPGRREIGHGALAERALLPVIPREEEFPYTIRLVSEVLSSNGSTSMASVCGSTLALMDAGVPIKAPVAGIAMGLITGEDGHYAVLTDIQGVEDALGDMDFKVAGTQKGITALQMDIKVKGISDQIMAGALNQAREARLYILEKMQQTIAVARPELSPYAPRMIRITIPVDKIGSLIGPGGKTIRSIIEETKATINVEDDGTVIIGSTSEDAAQRAIERIRNLTKEVEVGTVYAGKVTRVASFGAFVEILPGKEGLVHVSELADHRIPSVEEEVKIGDEVTVMVTEIDSMGRINLSRRAVLEGVPQASLARARARDAQRGDSAQRFRSSSREGGEGRGGFGPRGPRPGFRDDRGPGQRNGPPGRDR